MYLIWNLVSGSFVCVAHSNEGVTGDHNLENMEGQRPCVGPRAVSKWVSV